MHQKSLHKIMSVKKPRQAVYEIQIIYSSIVRRWIMYDDLAQARNYSIQVSS